MRYTIAAALLGGLLLAPAAAHAVEVRQSVQVKGEPAAVWAKIGAWCAIKDWHPAVAKCDEKAGAQPVRTVTLIDGGKFKETRLATAKTGYQYRIDESPLPVTAYKATFSVAPAKGKKGATTITWAAQFKAKDVKDAEAKDVITGVFSTGLESIKKSMGN